MKTLGRPAKQLHHFFLRWLPLCVPALLACAQPLALPSTGWFINFDYADYGFPAYGPGPAAAGSAGDLWNHSTVCTSLGNLTRADGLPSAISWNISSGGGWGINPAQRHGPYASLRDVSSLFYTASITGLAPNQSYQLYLYANANALQGPNDVIVNGVHFLANAYDWQMDGLQVGQQYDVHTVMADSNGALVFTPNCGQPNVSSWQLTPVPEPGILALAGLMLGTLVWPRAPRRR